MEFWYRKYSLLVVHTSCDIIENLLNWSHIWCCSMAFVCVNACAHLCASIISLPFDITVCLKPHLHSPSFNFSILLLSFSSLCHHSIHSCFRRTDVSCRFVVGFWDDYFAQWEVALAMLCLQFEVLFVSSDDVKMNVMMVGCIQMHWPLVTSSHASVCMPPRPCLPHSTFSKWSFTPISCTCCMPKNWSWDSFSFQCQKKSKKKKKQRCSERLILNVCVSSSTLSPKHLFLHLLVSYTLFWSARYCPKGIASLMSL